jgi:hypothetical protein
MTTKYEELLARRGTMGDAIDSRTASAAVPNPKD